jgi:hypothetical protein
MDCDVLQPLPEFAHLTAINHSMELAESLENELMSIRAACYEDCLNSPQQLMYHHQIENHHNHQSPADPPKNPLVWGNDIIFVDNSPEEEEEESSYDSNSNDSPVEASAEPEDSKMALSRELAEINNKMELTANHMILADMGDMNVMEDKFTSLPESFNFFPKDESELNEICSTLHLSSGADPAHHPLPPGPPPPAAVLQQSDPCDLTTRSPSLIIDVHPIRPSDPPHNDRSSRGGNKDTPHVVLEEILPRTRRTRTSSRRLSQPVEDPFASYGSAGSVKDFSMEVMDDRRTRTPAPMATYSKRRRNSSEHSMISTCSYDDPDSPYTGKRKRRRYEEDPSDDPAFEKSRKNAIIAKRNREKKKQMMEQMESRCDKLSAENEVLESDNGKLRQKVETLEEEVFYLKSVLANQSSLSNVLSSLKTADHLRLSSSFEASKYKKASRTSASQQQLKVSGGICLHVDGSHISMEMCQKCAQMACGAPRSSESTGRIKRTA